MCDINLSMTRCVMALSAFTILLSMVCLSFGYERTCTVQETVSANRRGHCKNLADLLSTICNGRFNDANNKHSNSKRSFPEQNIDLKLSANEVTGSDRSPFRSPVSALEVFRSKRDTFRTNQQSLVCECCVNMCSYTELREYCQTS